MVTEKKRWTKDMSKEFIEKQTQSELFEKDTQISPLTKDTNQYVKVPFCKKL